MSRRYAALLISVLAALTACSSSGDALPAGTQAPPKAASVASATTSAPTVRQKAAPTPTTKKSAPQPTITVHKPAAHPTPQPLVCKTTTVKKPAPKPTPRVVKKTVVHKTPTCVPSIYPSGTTTDAQGNTVHVFVSVQCGVSRADPRLLCRQAIAGAKLLPGWHISCGGPMNGPSYTYCSSRRIVMAPIQWASLAAMRVLVSHELWEMRQCG